MKGYLQFVLEDAPTNNAGSGNVDGIGVGPKGEPGIKNSVLVSRLNKKKNKVGSKWLASRSVS